MHMYDKTMHRMFTESWRSRDQTNIYCKPARTILNKTKQRSTAIRIAATYTGTATSIVMGTTKQENSYSTYDPFLNIILPRHDSARMPMCAR
jgi:hypothetical protein